MNKYILYTVLIFGLMMISACGGNNGASVVPLPHGDVSISDKVVQTTPLGTQVRSEKGVSDADLVSVDEGITQAINDGKSSGWTNTQTPYNHSLYIVYIPLNGCKPSPLQQIPSFLIRADNYDGSIYDQYNSKGLLPTEQQNSFDKYVRDNIGVIYAAEMLMGLNTPGSVTNNIPNTHASFVVCQETLKEGSRYGAEHNIIAHYDANYFKETMTHSTKAHPLLPYITRNNKKDTDSFVENKAIFNPTN